MNPRQKLTYLWDYYKVPVLGIPLVILLILLVIASLRTDTEPALSVYLINQPVTEDERVAFAAALDAALFPAETDGSTFVDASLTITPSVPDHESQVAFTTAIAGHTVDIMVGDMEFYTYYAQLDAFADFSGLLPDDLRERAAPYLLMAEGADGTQHPYGLDVSGLSLPASPPLNSAVLTVARTTEHTDAVLTFLYIYLM